MYRQIQRTLMSFILQPANSRERRKTRPWNDEAYAVKPNVTVNALRLQIWSDILALFGTREAQDSWLFNNYCNTVVTPTVSTTTITTTVPTTPGDHWYQCLTNCLDQPTNYPLQLIKTSVDQDPRLPQCHSPLFALHAQTLVDFCASNARRSSSRS